MARLDTPAGFDLWVEIYGDPDEAYEFNLRAFYEWRDALVLRHFNGK